MQSAHCSRPEVKGAGAGDLLPPDLPSLDLTHARLMLNLNTHFRRAGQTSFSLAVATGSLSNRENLATYKLVIRLGMRLAAAQQRQADPLAGPNPGARKGNPWGTLGRGLQRVRAALGSIHPFGFAECPVEALSHSQSPRRRLHKECVPKGRPTRSST